MIQLSHSGCLLMRSSWNRSISILKTWTCEPDRLWLVWPSFHSPRVWCAVVKISVMQQYLTAWTQASVFTQEAQVWVRHPNLCQVGCSHSQTHRTTNWFLPVCQPEQLKTHFRTRTVSEYVFRTLSILILCYAFEHFYSSKITTHKQIILTELEITNLCNSGPTNDL